MVPSCPGMDGYYYYHYTYNLYVHVSIQKHVLDLQISVCGR